MYRSVMNFILRLLESTFFAADDSTATSGYVEYIEQMGHSSCPYNTKMSSCDINGFINLIGPDRISEIWIIPVYFPAHGHGFPAVVLVGT